MQGYVNVSFQKMFSSITCMAITHLLNSQILKTQTHTVLYTSDSLIFYAIIIQ